MLALERRVGPDLQTWRRFFERKPAQAKGNESPRAIHAPEQLREILNAISMNRIEKASITLSLLGRALDVAGIVSDETLSTQLRSALEDYRRAVALLAERQISAVAPSALLT